MLVFLGMYHGMVTVLIPFEFHALRGWDPDKMG